MGSSVLLQLVRDSILEVFQARRKIDKATLLTTHPILSTPMNVKVEIFLDDDLCCSYATQNEKPLIDNIIFAAKKAAFEVDKEHILTSTQFLHCEIELTLYTPEGAMSERDKPIIADRDAVVFGEGVTR